jgi:predicted DNA-binding transcriptional regulator YafY
VASEKWHSKQVGRLFEDGSYELKVPYSNDPELLMDILKYGADCEVVEPEGLRIKVMALLKAALGRYGDD